MFRIDEKTASEIVKRYQKGEKPSDLARTFHVARSSVYRLIYSRTKRDVQSVTKLSQKEFHNMQMKLERLQRESEVFYACQSGRNSPLEMKVEDITRLKDQFGIHALCRILNVNRSAYYYHFLRSPGKRRLNWRMKNSAR